MAKCGYCELRKGKRNCPALGGPICSACCGGHRLTEIDCPANCSWLGGLRAVREGPNTIDFTGDDWDSAVRALFDTLHGRAGTPYVADAMMKFRFDANPRESEVPLFLSYASHVLRDRAGLRFIDRFVAAHGRDLSTPQVAALEALKDSKASLFRVERVSTATGFEVHDLIEDRHVTISEVSLSSQVAIGDLLFGWVMPRGDQIEFTGGVALIPPLYGESVYTEVIGELSNRQHSGARGDASDPVGEVAWCVVEVLRDSEARSSVDLVNTDGEEIMISQADYRLSDPEAARAALALWSDLEASGPGFDWFDARHAEGPRHVGHIAITSDTLSLVTNSRERLSRGKEMLEAGLGDLVSHQIDTYESPRTGLGEREPNTESSHHLDSESEDARLEAIEDALEAHYDTWADTPLPALGGQTPRQAARTPDGRDQVSDLLDDIESQTRWMPGGAAVEFGTIREDLGLDDEVLELLTPYNASRAYDPTEWLELDETLRLSLVEQYHRQLHEPHPVAGSSRMHAMIHVVVENQIAADSPPEASTAVNRLMKEGLSRHEAIHAAGSIVAGILWEMMQGNKQVDLRTMSAQLSDLTARKWLDSAQS